MSISIETRKLKIIKTDKFVDKSQKEKSQYNSKDDDDLVVSSVEPSKKRMTNTLRQNRIKMIQEPSGQPDMLRKYLSRKHGKESLAASIEDNEVVEEPEETYKKPIPKRRRMRNRPTGTSSDTKGFTQRKSSFN